MKKYGWILATMRLNWSNLVADSRAFWTLAVLMALNNLIYFMLWVAIFSRISSLRGWGLSEVAFLYGSGAFGYGILFTILGGLNTLSANIHDGMLDVYLARPRPVLPSILMHRMRADSLGDIISGIVMIFWFVRPGLADLPLIVALSMLAGIVYASWRLICHAAAFWGVGNEASENGFIAFLIAEILHKFDWGLFALQVIGSLGVLSFSIWLFHAGLKRYKSGNRFLVLR